MIKKQLEKTLKDAIKEDAYIIGTKQVIGNISKSKLVLLSKSVPSHISEKIEDDAKKSKVSTFRTMTHLLTLENSVDYNLEFQPFH